MKKVILFIIFLVILLTCFIYLYENDKITNDKISELNYLKKDKLENKVIDVQKLIKINSKYNNEIGFFIDMKILSGENRFFIYNFKTKKIIDQGLVAHGIGSETGIVGKLIFSNIDNSLCTSLGKYAIGYSYNGKFGKAYKLYGLDKTNSNAFNRNIVLHKFNKVPYFEQEIQICNSNGCPMVNEKFFARIEKIIDNSEKKIILSIFY